MPALQRVAGRPTWLLSRANAPGPGAAGAMPSRTEGLRGYHFRLLAALDQYGPSSQAELGRDTGHRPERRGRGAQRARRRGTGPTRARSRPTVVATSSPSRGGGGPPSSGSTPCSTTCRPPCSRRSRPTERTTFVRLLAKLGLTRRRSEGRRWYALGSLGGVAQPGRALRSQRRSRGFKSHHLHTNAQVSGPAHHCFRLGRTEAPCRPRDDAKSSSSADVTASSAAGKTWP